MALNSKIKIVSQNICLANNARLEKTFWGRLIGLMFSRKLPDCDAFILRPCNSIHTFFMNYSIDVVFVSKSFRVEKIIRNIRPWRMTWIYFRSSEVIEFMGGTLSEKIREGDFLEYQCTN